MNRRLFLSTPLLLTACGGTEMEYQIQPTPQLRTSKNVYAQGVEGRWTPVVTFTTPGDLAIQYAVQAGTYRKEGNKSFIDFMIETTAGGITHTTASGALNITGLPFASLTQNWGNVTASYGTLSWSGITKANYTHIIPQIAANGATTMQLTASGSGQAFSLVVAADVPTGGTLRLAGNAEYRVVD